MSISSEIERIKTNIANAYTEIENKGVVTTDAKNSDNLASTISAIQTGGTGGSDIEKGIKINGFDSDGYVSELETVGMTTLPDSYLRYVIYSTNAFHKAKVKLNEGLTHIGANNFYSSVLTEIDIPSTLTSIGAYAFYNSSISKIDLPSGVTYIPNNCFESCKFNVAILRGNITDMDAKAFYKVSNLQALILPNITSAPSIQYDTLYNYSGSTYVPDELVTTLSSATNWTYIKKNIKPISELPDEYKELL